jgi:hypothetical protein
MSKQEVLESCIYYGNQYGSLSWDDVLDQCDEKMGRVHYVVKTLEKMKEENTITFELDF